MIILQIVLLILVVAGVVSGIVLQVSLSGRESKYLGLILPGAAFLYSALIALITIGYDALMLAAALFLITSIPTLTLLGIYFACRVRRKMRKRLDKMSVQDLE